MKTLKLAGQFILATILSGLIVLFAVCCNDSYPEEPLKTSTGFYTGPVQLNDILNQLDFESGIVIVPIGSSIQDAVDASMPGGVIYIEPGIYKEAITINKPDIKLICLSNSDEQVILENPGNADKGIKVIHDGSNVKIFNIQLRNFQVKSTGVSQLKCAGDGKGSCFIKITRDELGSGIAHYRFEVRLGSGKFDVVRIHRVVREHRPYMPVRTKSNVFMVHGSIQDFDDIFLTAGAENINKETSLPFYLAAGKVDVWGIDLGWTLVPAETTDFTFMKDWGIERDVDHTLIAISVARLVRGFTGQGFGRLNLLGFSYGLIVAYGAAGKETQVHPVLRNIKGLIPVDHIMKYAPEDEESRLNACKQAAATKELIDNGTYQYDAGVTFTFLGNLALTAPDDPSPIPGFEGMTNYQVVLFLGTMTYLTEDPNAPYWHFVGGDLDNLYYTDPDRWLRLAVSLAPYQPQLQLYETYACACNEVDVSIDDHLGEITVPIFYLGAGGAMGTLGDYTSSLTASTDITSYIVSVNEDRMTDYGHADLFLGEDADLLAWEVLYNWLIDHSAI